MTYDMWIELGTLLKRMFRGVVYKRRIEIFSTKERYPQDVSYMAAYALKTIFPNGTIAAIAEWTPNSNYPEGGDWLPYHYVFIPKVEPTMTLDFSGVSTVENSIFKVKIRLGKTRNDLREFRLAPIDGQWSGNGLWEGDHAKAYNEKFTKQIIRDIQTTLVDMHHVLPKN